MPQVKHVVLLKLKRTTSEARIREIFQAIGALRGTIPGLLDFSGGPYSSGEGMNHGFTHGLVMTFADEQSRDAYLPHPLHERVKEMIIPELDGGLSGAIAFDWLHV